MFQAAGTEALKWEHVRSLTPETAKGPAWLEQHERGKQVGAEERGRGWMDR